MHFNFSFDFCFAPLVSYKCAFSCLTFGNFLDICLTWLESTLDMIWIILHLLIFVLWLIGWSVLAKYSTCTWKEYVTSCCQAKCFINANQIKLVDCILQVSTILFGFMSSAPSIIEMGMLRSLTIMVDLSIFCFQFSVFGSYTSKPIFDF